MWISWLGQSGSYDDKGAYASFLELSLYLSASIDTLEGGILVEYVYMWCTADGMFGYFTLYSFFFIWFAENPEELQRNNNYMNYFLVYVKTLAFFNKPSTRIYLTSISINYILRCPGVSDVTSWFQFSDIAFFKYVNRSALIRRSS